jgi:two-component system, NtrC family, sensor kinase
MDVKVKEPDTPRVEDGIGMDRLNPTASFDTAYSEAHDQRILIVDDEESVRGLFADYLGETYSCATAADAQEALELLAREPFALVSTDVQMPGLGGIDLLRKVTERYQDTAVIIVSGIDRTQRVIDAIRVGAADYIVKPCELDVLAVRIERALERRTLLRNARKYKRDLEIRNAELARQKAELERLQAQITHAEKMASLGQLAAGVAHELNNPAGFIHSNIDLLKEYLSLLEGYFNAFDSLVMSSDVTDRLRQIKKEFDYDNIVAELSSVLFDCSIGAERICDVVQNLKFFSRLDEADFKRADLNNGIKSTIRLLSGFYKSGRIKLRTDYGDLPEVSCYAAMLNQVWMNLLVNAAHSLGSRQGEVRVKSRSEGENVTVEISDTGAGIAPEDLKRIFDPFFTTKPVGEGTGLGLSISHSIVERHKGTIAVASTLGEGTTFIVTIPVAGQPSLDLN